MSATFRIGLKNVLGSNWTRTRHRWPQRAVMLEREMHAPDGMNASVYFLVEVNHGPERRSLARILPRWDVARSARGRNDAYSDPAVHRLIDFEELGLGTRTRQERYVTIARYEHVESGLEWTGATTHLSSSAGTTAELAAESRSVQGKRLAELCLERSVDVLAGDLNNALVRPGTPRAHLEAAGFTDWRDVIEVENVGYDSHRPLTEPLRQAGKHIDAIYLGPRVTAVDGRMQITEPGSSDHLGLACTVTVADR